MPKSSVQAGPADSGPRQGSESRAGQVSGSYRLESSLPGLTASRRSPRALVHSGHPKKPHSAAAGGKPPEEQPGAHGQRSPTGGSNDSGAHPTSSPREAVSRECAR